MADMTNDPTALSADAEAPRVDQESRWVTVRRAFRTAPLTAWFGMIVILLYILTAVFAPALAPFGEKEIVGDAFDVPGDDYLLGTDQLGRDMLSRMIYAARNTVGIALVTTILSFTLGSLLGMLAAVMGGWTDNILSRIVDVLMSIPQLIFALLLLTILGANVVNMILVIALLDSTRVYRLMRAVGMNIVVMDYVEAAKLRGEGLWWLIRKEILPNALAPLIARRRTGVRWFAITLSLLRLARSSRFILRRRLRC